MHRHRFSSLVGGHGPSYVPAQAPRSVRMRALRRLDNSCGLCLRSRYEALGATAAEAVLSSYETSLIINGSGMLSLLGLDSGKRSRKMVNVEILLDLCEVDAARPGMKQRTR